MATQKLQPRLLTEVPTALRKRGFEPPPYRHIRDAAVDGKIPAFKINRVWHFMLSDLPKIERALTKMRAEHAAKDAGRLRGDDALGATTSQAEAA
jgi:hypothetical protein